MKTHTSIAAHSCRLQEWAQMIQECNNRPVGMSVSEWCQANSITKANYYYRLNQVRKSCLDSLPSEVVEQAIVPVPMSLVSSDTHSFECKIPEYNESFIEVTSRGMTLRINENTSSSLIEKVLGVLAHVE